MSSNNDEIVSNFTAITGVDADRAKFYLESSGWNLDVAVGTFYQEDDDDMPAAPAAPAEPEEAPTRAAAVPQPKPRIATLSNMSQDSESDSDNSEEGQTFYAGGSERGGGQQIIGPKKKNADKVVKDVFESAQKHGAETVEAGSSASSGRRDKPTFRGTGYRLGESEEAPVEKIQGAPIEKPRNVDLVLKMWKNGFSVSDGPLRDYNDPSSMEFISYIKKGEIPPELTRMAKGGEVNLDMEDHRTEEYVKPKASVKPFQGSGNRLGSVAPPIATAAPPAEAQSNEKQAKSSVPVDTSKPVTNVQIRMADGGRLVAKFNHTNTVADIRMYIEMAHPQYTGASYVLQTTFPSRELTDLTETLEDAKLLNAAIVQRMK